MAAPKGNRFWEARSSHGRKPIFENSDQLWTAACEYFQWVEDNPLEEQKIFHAQGVITKDTVTKMRAMTVNGLCIFLDITRETFYAYKNKDGFSDICQLIESTIYEQKLTGAAADLFNASIIARELGLADKKEVAQKSVQVEIKASDDPQDAARAYQDLMGE